ncbi:hypothetical protein ACPPVU_12590 [Mucilaginibacter sp. McL0603]|uniref:hypothetical protein n=1 Tax=Mucilaginibacter sp. McL0603 TaxID=3415670 RepID=UPI003CF7D114
MDTAKINTLQQVNAAIAALDQIANDNTDPATAIIIEKISHGLETIKNDIISEAETALVNALGSDTKALNDLVAQIDAADTQLDKITGIVKTISTTIGTLVNITSSAMSAGLL